MKNWKAALFCSSLLMCSGCDALNGLIAPNPECSTDDECGAGKWCSSKAQCIPDTDKEESRLRVNRILSGVESYPGEFKRENCDKVDALMYRFVGEASAADSPEVHAERVKAAVSLAKKYQYSDNMKFEGYEDVNTVCRSSGVIESYEIRQNNCRVWKLLADEGLSDALFIMGLMHLTCHGEWDAPDLEDSKRKARAYFEKAAAKGNMDAICYLGQEGCSSEDNRYGVFDKFDSCDYTDNIKYKDAYRVEIGWDLGAKHRRLKQVFVAEDGSKTEFTMRNSVFEKYIERDKNVFHDQNQPVTDGTVDSDKYTDMTITYSPETSDHYNRKAVRYPFSRNVVALMGCYDRMPREPERLEGSITLKASIDTEGKVTQASFVNSTFNNEAFGKCLVDDMKDWVFPKSGKQAAYEVKAPIEYKWHTQSASHLGRIGAPNAILKALNPDVAGSLDKRVVQKVVRQHVGELRACYEKELAKDKGLKGRVSVAWVVATNGSVTKVFIKDTTMKNKTVETCIKDSVGKWRFPQPKGGGIASIVYPFEFASSK